MIDLVTLKKDIENNSLSLDKNKILIFIGKDKSSEFIFDQYLHEYVNNNNLEIIIENELTNDIEFFTANSIRIFKTKKLDQSIFNFKGWIYCNSISSSIKNKYDNNIIELPKLEEWQIIDYISTKGNINIEQAKQLFKKYNDLYKANIELNKLSIFNKNNFDAVRDQLFIENEYVVFDLTNAILQRDIEKIQEIYKSNLKVEVFVFLALLIKNFKLVIDIQLAKNSTAESLGISGKQFWAVKRYNCNKYSKDELIYIYNLLTSIDLRIKSGNITIDIVQDYIVFKILLL